MTDYLYQDAEVEDILMWLKLHKIHRLGKSTRDFVTKYREQDQKQPHLILDKQNAPIRSKLLISAPLGSGLTVLSKHICKSQGFDALIIDACNIKTIEDLNKNLAQNQVATIFKSQKRLMLVIENIENASTSVMNMISKAKPQKPFIITASDPFAQGMRQLRNNCLHIQLRPSYDRCASVFRDLTKAEWQAHHQNFEFLSNNLVSDGKVQISQPTTTNIVIGLLLRLPEVLLNLYDQPRFAAQQHLVRSGYRGEYGSADQFFEVLQSQSVDYQPVTNKLLQNIFSLQAMAPRIFFKSANLQIPPNMFDYGDRQLQIYGSLVTALSDQEYFGVSPALTMLQFCEQFQKTTFSSSKNMLKAAETIQFSGYYNPEYDILQLKKKRTSADEYETNAFAQSIVYFSARGLLNAETVTPQERLRVAEAAVILGENPDLFEKQENDADADDEPLAFVEKKHTFQYVEQGVSIVQQRVLASLYQNGRSIDQIVERLTVVEMVEENVVFEYHQGVTLAVRVPALFSDFF